MIRAIYMGCVCFSWWNTTQGGETVRGNMVFHGVFSMSGRFFRYSFSGSKKNSYEKMTILLLWIVSPYPKQQKLYQTSGFCVGEVGARAPGILGRGEMLILILLGGSTPSPKKFKNRHQL